MATSFKFLWTCTLVFACYLGSARGDAKWENCGPRKTPVTVKSFQMVPDPPVSGHNFSILLPSVSNEELQGGYVYVYVTYYGIPVHIESDDLCTKTACPVAPGPFLFKNVQGLPSITPAGSYKVRLTATDVNGNVLFCTRVSFQIVRESSSSQVDSFWQRLRDFVPSLFKPKDEESAADAQRLLEEAARVWSPSNRAQEGMFKAMTGVEMSELEIMDLENTESHVQSA